MDSGRGARAAQRWRTVGCDSVVVRRVAVFVNVEVVVDGLGDDVVGGSVWCV